MPPCGADPDSPPAGGAGADRRRARQPADRRAARDLRADGAGPRLGPAEAARRANRTQAAVAAVQRGCSRCFAVARPRSPLRRRDGPRRPRAVARSARGHRLALDAGRGGRQRRLGLRHRHRTRDRPRARGDAARAGLGREASHLRDRARAAGAGGASRRPAARDGRSAGEGAGRRPLHAGAGDPRSADAGLGAPGAARSRQPGVARSTAASTATRATSTAAAAGPSSGFAISPYVGPLSALALNHGLPGPSARGFQPDPALFVGPPARSRARPRRRRRRPAARARGARPRTRGPLATVSSPPLALARAAHEPGVRQLLRGDADQGPRRALRRRAARRRPARRRRSASPADLGVERASGRRLGALARRTRLAARGRPAPDRARGTSPGSTPSTARCRWRADSGTLRSGCAAPPRRAAAAPRPAR